MSFSRPTLSELDSRILQDALSRFNALSNTPRYNLLKALCKTDAGLYHLVYGNLDFLSKQIFPDTAESEYLRAHWSDRVPPLPASFATGEAVFTGNDGSPIPAGLLLQSDAGINYSLQAAVSVNGANITGTVKALTAGAAGNLAAGSKLTIVSTLPAGVDSEVTVDADGISGGADSESDEEYLSRVLEYLRTGARYGKPGDWKAWGLDALAEVSKGFEIPNFGNTGALLLQVIAGNQVEGVNQVSDLETIEAYLSSVAPPVPFLVKTPELIPLNPTIILLLAEDTEINRTNVLNRLKQFLDVVAKPALTITQGALEDVVIDGVEITDATVTLVGGSVYASALQYPVLGAVAWA